jgi:hypothetical protein
MDIRPPFMNGGSGLDAVHDRHHDIHQYYVRLGFFTQSDSFLAVAGFADERQVILRQQNGAESAADHGMVIDKQDFDLI